MARDLTTSACVNLAVIGCGYWGTTLIRVFSNTAGARILGFCRANREKLTAMREQYPEARLYPTFTDVAEDPDVQAVVIATPPTTHFDLAKQALLAGKHVFVEKPMCLQSNQARELVQIAESEGLVLLVGHVLQYAPAVGVMKRIVHQGLIGPLRHIHMERLKLGTVRREENVWWSFAPHDVSVATFLLGKQVRPVRVQALGHCYVQPTIADIAYVDLVYPSGVSVHIHVSWLHPEARRRVTLIGEKAMLVWDDLSSDRKLTLYHKSVEPAGLTIADEGEEVVPVPDGQPLQLECAHFIECVIGRARPISDGHDGLYVVEILETADGAMRTRRQ